jgi:hypothetical protein
MYAIRSWGSSVSTASDYRLDDWTTEVPWGKVRPRRDADHLPPFSAEVKNELELYVLSALAPAWSNGTALILL